MKGAVKAKENDDDSGLLPMIAVCNSNLFIFGMLCTLQKKN